MRTRPSDREIVMAFVAFCGLVIGLALSFGLAVRVFVWVAGL